MNPQINETEAGGLIEPRAVHQLLKESFYVPSYQRGYRWTTQQVTELLEDLREFCLQSAPDDFYCLQPVVVKKYNEKEWEVIDGQQRLTTIHILLSYFNSRLIAEHKKELFSMRYETRQDSAVFLSNINKEQKDKNIDYHFIYSAFQTITDWFRHHSNLIYRFEDTLLNRVKVIWYEAEEKANSIEIFTRINVGKIPLTNAELIRALFLRRRNFAREAQGKEGKVWLKQLQIASEWDSIEKTLQNDAFWYFINDNNKRYDTRIEYLFDLMKDKKSNDEANFTFYEFNKDFESGQSISDLWKKVKDFFLTFEEWFQDRQLYHLVGFLVATGSRVPELKAGSEFLTKNEFVDYLKTKVKEKVAVQVDDLVFGDKKIKTVLLLFNLQTLFENEQSNVYFPFDRFKTESWDIEHIRSRTSFRPEQAARRPWLEMILEYLTGVKSPDAVPDAILDELKEEEKTLVGDIVGLLSGTSIAPDAFDRLYDRVLRHFKEGEEPENIDSLSNLTLLDAATNRGYKNAPFPVKRRTIIENDKKGTFVPICTKNVFLKYFSRKLDGVMYWQASDADDYLQAIKTVLAPYLPTQNQQQP